MAAAVFSCNPATSRGRRYPESPAPTRNEFQRDRDRIVHSTAFRRLVYKTQVFLNHEGDLFRTRMTHSLEVAQIGRSLARELGLHEDLVEAIALAHDLGHTPFGHAGQDALDQAIRNFRPEASGFEHNLQSLRVVDKLEERYPTYDGLNLTFESREGILKHCSGRNARWLESIEPDGVASRFLYRTSPSLEAQLCNLCDEMAYNAHDLDDGVRSGVLEVEDVYRVEIVRRFHDEALVEHPTLSGRRLLFETVRRMLSEQIYDVARQTRQTLALHGPEGVDAVRRLPQLVSFSPEMEAAHLDLKRFLRTHLYRHPRVQEKTRLGKQVVDELFGAYLADPDQMRMPRPNPARAYRRVADYIAGMTDRFAVKEHARLTGRQLFD